jgi:hypothetical protein
LKNFDPPDNVVLAYKTGATFNAEVINDQFLNRVMVPHVSRFNLKNTHLLLDSAACHKASYVHRNLEKNSIAKHIIPAGFTNLLQPADVCWFSFIKNKLHERWTDWYINDEKTFTKANNMRSPGYANVIKWISDVWDEMDENIIRKSFDQCGITSDNQLHSVLNTILQENSVMTDFVCDEHASDEFEMDDIDLFDSIDQEVPVVNVSMAMVSVPPVSCCENCKKVETKKCKKWVKCAQCNKLYCSMCKRKAKSCCQ